MKPSRAPGPTYVQMHRQRVPKAPQNEKKPKKIVENPSNGEGGVLRKFMNIDDIPDFPADDGVDVWNSLSNKKPSGSDGQGMARNRNHKYNEQEDDDEDDDEIEEEDYYQNNKPPQRAYNEDNNDNEWNSQSYTPQANKNNAGYSQQQAPLSKQVQFQNMNKPSSAPRTQSATSSSRGRSYQASGDSSDDDNEQDIPEDLGHYNDQQYNNHHHAVPSPTKKKALPKPSNYVPPPQLPCEQTPEKPLAEGDKLFFSKKPRAVEYKPYTLDQYKLIKPKEYVEIGKMKPDLNTDELVAKRKNAERIKEFSRQLRGLNKESIIAQPKLPPSHEQSDIVLAKQKLDSKRNRGLEFAKHIPRPKVVAAESAQEDCVNTKRSQSAGEQGGGLFFDDESREAAKLEELLNKHSQGKAKIEAIKKTLVR